MTQLFKQKRAASIAALLFTGAAFGGASGGCKGRVPNMIGKGQQVELGQNAAQQIERQERIVTSGPQYERLQRVANRLIPLAKQNFDVPYTVKLIDSKDINAFALPGGPVYFYTGLMELAQTDDEVAGVVGHELAHVVQQHSAKQMSQANFEQLVAGLALGRQGQAAQIAGGALLQLNQLRYSRGDESESDKVGFRYMVQAGFNPDGMAAMFSRMEAKSGGRGGPEWLRSHPLTKNRVETTQRYANEYKQSGKLP
jgi:predicted Zn-dependent protease